MQVALNQLVMIMRDDQSLLLSGGGSQAKSHDASFPQFVFRSQLRLSRGVAIACHSAVSDAHRAEDLSSEYLHARCSSDGCGCQTLGPISGDAGRQTIVADSTNFVVRIG